MKILVIWRLLTVGGVNAGWRNRAIYLKKHGITTEFLYVKDLGGMHMMKDVAPVYLTKDKQEILKIINENKYDAIIVVDTNKAYKWLIESNYSGPIIVEARTPEITKLKRNLEGYDKVTPQAFIVPTEYQKRVLSILIDQPIPIHVINNCIDTNYFQPISNVETFANIEPIVPEHKKIVAFIGRLDQRKNWRLLLTIAQEVKKERNDLEFWVIGGAKSVEREIFEKEWKEQGLTDIVKWFPVIRYQDMIKVYGKIKQSGGCTIATTKAESFGNTFIEAMACGIPVLAPGVSSIPEIVIDGETGYLYNEGHVQGAKEKLYRIIDNQKRYKRLSKAARARVESLYSQSYCTEKYVKLLQEVTKGGV